MQRLFGQGGPRFGSKGICGKTVLQLVIRIMRDVAYTTPVNNGRFLLFCKKFVKLGVVARCYY